MQIHVSDVAKRNCIVGHGLLVLVVNSNKTVLPLTFRDMMPDGYRH